MKRRAYILAVILLILSVEVQSFSHVQVESATQAAAAHVESLANSILWWNKTYGGTGSDLAFALVQTTDGGYSLAGRADSSGAGLADFWLVRTDANGNQMWNKTYGGAYNDVAESTIQTNDGGYALTGPTYSFGAGSGDFWLVKTDANGDLQWNKTYGGTGDEYGRAVIQTDDGGYALTGSTKSFGAGLTDFWFVKTDAVGNHLWNKTYGGTGLDDAQALVQTADGGYTLTGRTGSFGAGSSDFWLVKTDPDGNMMWNRTYGGTGEDRAYELVQTADGGYTLAGYTLSFGAGGGDFWLVKTDASGNPQWNKTYGGEYSDSPFALVQTADEGYALAGLTYSFGAGGSDIWLMKTDADGNAQWNQTCGGTGEDYAGSVVQMSDGGYALAGGTSSFGAGSDDFWLVRTLRDVSTVLEWNKTYGGTGSDFALALVQTVDGGYALAGRTYSFGAGSSDIWLVKTDESGNHLWNRTYGGTNVDGVFAFVQTVDGGFALAGHTYSFGAGNSDIWLVKTDSTGNMVWNKTYGGTGEDWAYALTQTGDGGYAIAGETASFGAGSGDVWLVRTDAVGNHLWNKTYGGTKEDDAFDFVQTVDGGFALAGHTYSFGAGSCDAWLVKTSADGNHEWNETFGGIAEDFACRLVQTKDDYGYVLAGITKSYGAGSDDFWLFKTRGQGSTIIVPDDYLTIQEAINNAADGDTVFVKTGIYFESVTANKTVSLVGEDVSATVVDGSGSGNVFTINKNYVSINSFTIQNSGTTLGDAGLRLDNVNHCSISGNRIRDNFAGIWFESASENQITANEITGNVDDGIVFNYSHNNTISENQIALHEYFGIVINWSHNNTICYNNVTQTSGPSHGDGINLWRSSSNSIFQNRVEDNARYGIRIEVQSNNNTVSHNTIGNCITGLQVYDSSNFNLIYENNIAGCSDGIDINEHSTKNTVSKNTITDSEICGLQVYNAENNLIDGNNLRNNWAGIGAHGKSQYNRFNGNCIENCTKGVILHDSDYNSISENNITNCEIAVHFEWLTNFNTAEQNNISDNHIGIQLEQTGGNIFCHNNILSNTFQVSIIEYASDTWDDGYPSGGNYWSDYTGIDVNSDGVGDTPYVIDTNNIDNYPLMSSWVPPDIAVVSLSASKTAVFRGLNLPISVAVQNLGNKVEGFNLTIYANATVIHSQYFTLAGENPTAIAFTWETSGSALGNYTLTAVVDALEGEANVTDNVFVDDIVAVRLLGDLNCDSIVDGSDIMILTRSFGSFPGHPTWNIDADMNEDDVIDGSDIVIACRHFGESSSFA